MIVIKVISLGIMEFDCLFLASYIHCVHVNFLLKKQHNNQ